MRAWTTSLFATTSVQAVRYSRRALLVTTLLLPPACCFGQSLTFLSGGGPKTLTITTAAAGSDPDDVVDDATQLTWDALGIGSTAKITVDTSVPGQSFSLFVSLNVTVGSGTEQPERQLVDGMAAADLLRDIPTAAPTGTGTITYRAAATAAQGNSAENGSDVHTITYTILAQ